MPENPPRPRRKSKGAPQGGDGACRGKRVLVIGRPDLSAVAGIAEAASLTEVPGLRALTAAHLHPGAPGLAPDLVIAPLVGGSFDIIDTAARLEALGYRGRLVATSEPLPNVAAVEAEVQSGCRHIRFSILTAGAP